MKRRSFITALAALAPLPFIVRKAKGQTLEPQSLGPGIDWKREGQTVTVNVYHGGKLIVPEGGTITTLNVYGGAQIGHEIKPV